MREIRYTSAPTLSVFASLAMLVLAATMVVPLVRQIIREAYNSSFAGNMKIAFPCLAFIYAVRGIVTWYESRNKVAFIVSAAGIWTEKTDWLTWQSLEFKIDGWPHAMSVAYAKEGSVHLLQWPLSELNTNRADLLKACQEYTAMAE